MIVRDLRHEPIVREINDLAADTIASGPRIRLKLFHCPRNQSRNMYKADHLARLVVERNKYSKRRIRHDTLGGIHVKIYNDVEHRTQSAIMGKLAPQLQAMARMYTIDSRKVREPESSSATQVRRRKTARGRIVEEKVVLRSEDASVEHVGKRQRASNAETT